MDWFAIASSGAYPTAGATAAQRAAYGVSYGLLALVPTAIAGGGAKGLGQLGMCLTTT